MTPEVKKRIDQIRNGIVPEGYKKGKLGIVPGEWDEIPFSTLFTSTSDYTDNLHQYPLYSLTIEDGITAKTERYERSHLVKKDNSYKVVRPNDYAYNPMNIRFGAVARHKGDIPVAVSGYYHIFTTVHKSDLVFMDSFLTCGPMITYYNKVSTGSLIEKQRVHFSDFLEFSLALPPLEERKKIAEILTTQDKAIELERQRIDEILKVKQFFLGKMFPKKGQAVPEIRFKGFTGVWEQRKLEDYLTVSAEKNTGNIYGRSDVLSVSGDYGIVNQIEFQGRSFAGASVSNYGVVQTGNVVYTKSPLNSNPYGIIKTNKGKPGIVSTLYAVYHPKENAFSDFIQVYFEQHARMNNYMHPLVNKGAKNDMKVSAENALKGPVCFPSRIEQESISAFFSVLDNLITLHQRKLEEEKKKKKALMQLLLTGIVRV